MKSLNYFVAFLLALLLGTIVKAQDQSFLPAVSEPIQISNAKNLMQFNVVGGGKIDQISLSPDGQFLGVVTRLGINIHDLNNPSTVPRTIVTEYGPIINALFNPDWSWVVVCTPTILGLFDLETGQLTQEFVETVFDYHSTANEMALSSDGHWLATTHGWDSGLARVWDTRTGEMIYVQSHRYQAGSPIFGPSDDSFAYVYHELQIFSPGTNVWYLVDTNDWNFFRASQNETYFGKFATEFRTLGLDESPFSTGNVDIIASPDGSVLVARDYDDRLRVWDGNTGELRFMLPENYLFKMFSPDGQLLILDKANSDLLLMDVSTEATRKISSADDYASFAFSADSKKLAVADLTGITRTIQVETGQVENVLSTNYLGSINDVVFNQDGSYLYFIDNSVNLRQLNMMNGEIRLIAHVPNATGRMAFSATLSQLMIATSTGDIEIWDAEKGKLVNRLHGHEQRVTDVAFGNRSSILASASEDGTIRLWDVSSGESHIIDRYDNRTMDALAFSPDDTQLLAADTNNGLGAILYDLANNTQIATDSPSASYKNAAFSLNGAFIALGGYSVEIWDNTSGHLLEGDDSLTVSANGRLLDMAFNPRGDLLFTAATDSYSHTYNAVVGSNPLNAEEIVNLQGYPDAINTFAFSPDGRFLALDGQDGTIRVWGVP